MLPRWAHSIQLDGRQAWIPGSGDQDAHRHACRLVRRLADNGGTIRMCDQGGERPRPEKNYQSQDHWSLIFFVCCGLARRWAVRRIVATLFFTRIETKYR